MDKRAETMEAAREFFRGNDYAKLREAFEHGGEGYSWAANKVAELMADFHLSQSRDAWTPVERLPEMDGSYVVTVEPMDKSLDLRTETAMWESRHDGWLINGSTWGKVIAWMPLPAPYEQEK
jgi:hypothetical protein